MFIKNLLQMLLNTRASKQEAKDASAFLDGTYTTTFGGEGIAPADGFITAYSSGGGGSGVYLKLTDVDSPSFSDCLSGASIGAVNRFICYLPIRKGQRFTAQFVSSNEATVAFFPRALT